MERRDELCQRAHLEASNWLRRYRDPWTRAHRDDLVQEASFAAWRWAGQVRHSERFWAAVQTIARRIRSRSRRAIELVQPAQSHVDAALARESDAPERHYLIAGRRVAVSVVRPCLRRSLQRLTTTDRELLLGFYEGFCCAELAERFRRSTACVKTRIHRARRRVRRSVEVCVRTTTDLDD